MGEQGRRRQAEFALVLSALILSVALATALAPPRPGPTGAGASVSSVRALAAPPAGAHFDYVVTIVMENHAICDILTTCGGVGPFQTQLSESNGLATGYVQCGPSLPNYLCLTGASTFGCTANYPPNSNSCTAAAWAAPNIIDRLVDAGLTWKAYMENMTVNCQSTSASGYAVKHDPFVYYGDIATNATRCARVVPAGANDSALLSDLASTSTASNYMWLTPNTCNDVELCRVATGDQFLSTLVPKILNSTIFRTQRAALFLTYDEASGGRGAPDLYTVWAGGVAKSDYTSSRPYYHISALATVESNWNLAPLNSNDTAAANMTEFFRGPGPDFSLSAEPFAFSLITGHTAAAAIRSVPYYGFDGTVALTAASSRSGLTVVCSPTTIQGNESSECTMSSSTKGSYTVTVTGANGTLIRNVTIAVQVVDPLVVSASFSPQTPAVGQLVNFTAAASGGSSPYWYSWDLGDGSSGATANVSHTYVANRTFDANLTVLDSGTLSVNLTLAVSVAASPPVVLTEPAIGVTDTSATLQGLLENLGGIPSVTVGFVYGPGATPSQTFNLTAGPANVSGGFSDSITGLAPNTTYSYSAWATGAGSSAGGIQDFTTLAFPPPPLTADFSFSPTAPQAGETVTFTATVSGGVPPYAERWDFGAASIAEGVTVSRSFAAGTYSVNLTVADSAGHVAHVTHTLSVASSPPPVSPSATLGLNGTTGKAGWYVSQVTVTPTVVDAQGPDAWLVYLVDGGSPVNSTAPFVLGEGKHTIAYHAADAYGAPPEAEQALNVSVDTTPPRLEVDGPSGTVVSSSVTIRWIGSDGESGISGYAVVVDGGSARVLGLATNATLTLPDGVHTVTVRATDVAGNSVTQTITVRVDTNPFSLGGPFAGLPTFALLAAVAVGIVFLLLRDRRERSPPGD